MYKLSLLYNILLLLLLLLLLLPLSLPSSSFSPSPPPPSPPPPPPLNYLKVLGQLFPNHCFSCRHLECRRKVRRLELSKSKYFLRLFLVIPV
jgi:hypothetical protein